MISFSRLQWLPFFLTFFTGVNTISAQDKSFSQYFNSPLQLNPALSGVINGTYRVNFNYRDQWNKLEGGNYSTVNASGDLNFKMPLRGFQNDRIGIGLSFMSDKANDFGMQTNDLAFVGAYHKSVGKAQFLSLGFKFGVYQRTINYENLRFEDQYVEGSGYSAGTSEVLPENNISFGDLSVGLNYNWSPIDDKSFNIGASLQHITSPDFSFFNLSLPPNTVLIKQPLYGLFSMHASGSFALNNLAILTPRIWTLAQGPHFQGNLGASYKLAINNDRSNKLILGSYLRSVKDERGLALESFIPLLGVELSSLNISFNYDANLRRIAPGYFQQSIFEIGITFTGNANNENNICPRF
ncbi:MAG: PorP/SprF family type IX secretion system membrane protein [Saprospiraceae bacterium]